MKLVGLALAAVLAVATPASAKMLEKTGTFAGLEVTYKVLLPPGYDNTKAYPAVLLFSGGPQQLRGAESSIITDWKQEADKRGYIVISPAAPAAGLFFQGGARIFPAFLDQLRRDYRIAGKFHVAGHSNGGLSAFHVAANHPSYLATVTGYPGLLQPASDQRLQALKPMCLFMHVGDQDPDWAGPMKQQQERLRRAGFRIRFTAEPNQVHRLRAAEIDLSRRLFDEIESCR